MTACVTACMTAVTAYLDVVPDVEGVVVVGLEVRPPLEGLWRGDAGRTQHPLTSAASVNILKSG